MKAGRLVWCAAAWLALAGAAAAQPPAQSLKREGRAAADAQAVKPGELANALDQYALVQAQRMLQLNDAQFMQFVPRLRTLQQTRRRNQVARHRLVQELKRLAGPRATGDADDATLRERLAALKDHDARAFQELRAAYDAIDEVLDPRQQARFRLFEENIEARKLELMMRARSRPGAGGGGD